MMPRISWHWFLQSTLLLLSLWRIAGALTVIWVARVNYNATLSRLVRGGPWDWGWIIVTLGDWVSDLANALLKKFFVAYIIIICRLDTLYFTRIASHAQITFLLYFYSLFGGKRVLCLLLFQLRWATAAAKHLFDNKRNF